MLYNKPTVLNVIHKTAPTNAASRAPDGWVVFIFCCKRYTYLRIRYNSCFCLVNNKTMVMIINITSEVVEHI